MDEATSSLDNITEQEISAAIHGMSEDKTVLIVAHRLSTIRQCDRIFFLRAGKVEVAKSFEENVRLSSGFKALVDAWRG